MKREPTRIWVYADWDFMEEVQLMGYLTSQSVRGKEVFSFEYTESWLNHPNPILFLDPHLGFYKGKQSLTNGEDAIIRLFFKNYSLKILLPFLVPPYLGLKPSKDPSPKNHCCLKRTNTGKQTQAL